MHSNVHENEPNEMHGHTLFNATSALAPRLGRLCFPGRKSIQTPHYIPITSRGAMPHVSHDVMRDHVPTQSLYIALEDFIERGPRETPPVYQFPSPSRESTLRNFLSLPDDLVLVLGPRRVPPVVCSAPNTSNSISILTSVGFRQLEEEEYVKAIQTLRPDFSIGLSDIVLGQPPGVKRREKMVDRTHAWTRDAVKQLYGSTVPGQTRPLFLAPLLPLEKEIQSMYVQELEDEMKEFISGFALFDASATLVVPESMSHLIRLCFGNASTPHDILREILLGVDLTTAPFVTALSDAGLAFNFTFPQPLKRDNSSPLPLAIDIWSTDHSTDVSPLVAGCECYSCTTHHRAYIQHLLNAKEMLAWTLLQIHNHQFMTNFFAAIRKSISNGSFSQDVDTFQRVYESKFPEQTGLGPRIRGYQTRSEYGAQKKNPKVYGRLDDHVEKLMEAESSVATPETGAGGLEAHGFAKILDQ
ncbi:hypothetical protein LOZ49_000442 [Ophidiomyces ophidiicola]|nr:hypothetical protein LOZ49_000442 [Ophidiomyces ophidiicola]KAI2026442.1 hypothetical protein LOZ46_000434 [Ophidiomyces ophidiicola]KAI2226305.1 hypothetical protein LOZ15_000149 [Ophidiomyces ophidiicola]